jgi:hypothetical protein
MSQRKIRIDLSSKKGVVLVLPGKAADSTGPVMRGPIGDTIKEFTVGLEEVSSWFKDFDIDSIEISITAGVETGGLTKLFLSAKGEGGLTVTMKPKKQTA